MEETFSWLGYIGSFLFFPHGRDYEGFLIVQSILVLQFLAVTNFRILPVAVTHPVLLRIGANGPFGDLNVDAGLHNCKPYVSIPGQRDKALPINKLTTD